jgi:hypothetical protein
VTARLQQISAIQQPIPYKVALKELPQQNIVSIREIVPHLSQMGKVRDRLLGLCRVVAFLIRFVKKRPYLASKVGDERPFIIHKPSLQGGSP